jgi:hypothetical protein
VGEAHETTSRVLREANPGDDYDISNVTTEPL